MNPIQELNDDLLVEEGHYLERIQNEALEEGFLYSTVRDFEAIVKEYGASYVIQLLDTGIKRQILSMLV